jgi:hypothetical protein
VAALLMVERSRQIPDRPVFRNQAAFDRYKGQRGSWSAIPKTLSDTSAIQLDNVILVSRLGKEPGNLGKKVKNVIDSDLYFSRLTAINEDYAEVTGNMGKFWLTSVLAAQFT